MSNLLKIIADKFNKQWQKMLDQCFSQLEVCSEQYFQALAEIRLSKENPQIIKLKLEYLFVQAAKLDPIEAIRYE